MANLIITIIAIALVAVAALMSAYYGGAAFLEGQTKARVNGLVSQVQQILAGMQLYALDNGFDDASYGLLCNLVNSKYLQSGRVPPLLGIVNWNCSNGTGRLSPASSYAVWGGSATYMEMYPVILYDGTAPGNGPALYVEFQGAGDYTSASAKSDPLVQACVALNSRTTLGANYVIQASGLPKRSTGNFKYINAYTLTGGGHTTSLNTGIGMPNICEVFAHDAGKLKMLLQ